MVIFDNDLSPAQTRSLEQSLGVKVIDRTELILDIFASHAQTNEARMAVELAQLEYSLPRLKRMWTHLSRLKMGVGMRGPGEKQLEVDRRLVEKRIFDLRLELRRIEDRKQRQVAARCDHMTVSLVGYTNAGKSTLMNALTGAGVKAADQLFATLDTRTRRWQLPNWGPVLLSDTVGFIRDLPHGSDRQLQGDVGGIASSRPVTARLRCVQSGGAGSDHGRLSSAGRARYRSQRHAAGDQQDRRTSRAGRVETILRRYPNGIPVSARTGQGLPALALAVSDGLSRTFRELDVETGVDNGRLMAYLAAHGEILSRRYHNSRVTIHCRLPQKYLGRIQGHEIQVRPHSPHDSRLLPDPSSSSQDPPAYPPAEASPAALDDVA